MAKAEVCYLFPTCTDQPKRNIWVLITETRPQKGTILRSVRVFSTEPPESILDWQKKIHAGDESEITMELLPVAIDHFDDEEIEAVGC
jgi:hypothetical protein